MQKPHRLFLYTGLAGLLVGGLILNLLRHENSRAEFSRMVLDSLESVINAESGTAGGSIDILAIPVTHLENSPVDPDRVLLLTTQTTIQDALSDPMPRLACAYWEAGDSLPVILEGTHLTYDYPNRDWSGKELMEVAQSAEFCELVEMRYARQSGSVQP